MAESHGVRFGASLTNTYDIDGNGEDRRGNGMVKGNEVIRVE